MALTAVIFDVGETLVDETTYWESIANRHGVPRFTFMATLGGLIERGEPHRRVFEVLGLERPAPAPQFAAALYHDVVPCIEALRLLGYRLGAVGNTPRTAEAFLREAGLRLDLVASSAAWGVEKPEPEFFTRIVDSVDGKPDETVYVGDRLDNDVLPADAAGLIAVHIRRGPWGILQERDATAHRCIDSLTELPDLLVRV